MGALEKMEELGSMALLSPCSQKATLQLEYHAEGMGALAGRCGGCGLKEAWGCD